ncbi:unnamed protein product [Orchesella dallaii]|uniref:B(0,+)-type amino acid transporter 1 n=1 Tax=Orchesella dallaii TaxID=48710 RepID=A0ABP1QVU3_9HEXA
MDNSAFTQDTEIEQHGQGPGFQSTPNPAKDTKKQDLLDEVVPPIPIKSDGTVRSGIFVSPSGLLEKTGSVSLSLVVWAACGVLATLAALSYCELGTVVPRSGGEHAYYMATFPPLNRFFGEIPGFLFAWATVLLLKPSSLSIVSLAAGKYALYPLLRMDRYECKNFEDDNDFKYAVKLLAVVVASLIAAVNIISARLATKAAIVFLFAKVSTMAIMIGIGFYNMGKGDFGALTGGWDPTNKTVGDIAVSFYSGLWAYDGWNNLNLATEELVNPHRNLPLAILIGIPLSTVLYLLINVSYLTALSKEAMIASDAVAVDVGDNYLGALKLLIPILVVISAIGTGNGSMFTAGRITYAVGRDGHMIDVMSYVHATRLTPIVALSLNTILAYAMIFGSEIEELIDLFGFASWIIYGLAISCVIVLRYTMPDAPRPFKVPLIIPIVAVIISAALVVLPIVYDPKLGYLAVLGFFLLGFLVYIPFVYYKYRLPGMDGFTKAVQFLTLAAPSPYKDD